MITAEKTFTEEQHQDLVDTIKRPVRYYRVNLNGYGGEAAYINISKEAYDFWKDVVEEHYDNDLVNYAVNDDPADYDFDDIKSVPPEADFLTDKEGYKYPWYEAPGEYVHQYGVAYNGAYLHISEVDSDEYVSNTIEEIVEGEELQEYLDGVMEKENYDIDLVEADEDLEGEGDYVIQFYSSEKGCFFDGIIETTSKFDPKKLKIVYTEYPNGEDTVTGVEYDGEWLDNQGGDTNGKGYSAHLWHNK